MDVDDRVIDIHGYEVLRATGSQQRCPGCEISWEAGRDRVELTDVPEREGPQERTQVEGA
ncbi:hypothetical protein NicSoilB8_17820 [Arthrobacter sp. NicSoilB8]|nr:hypothetical protein NicSoilB8_17820 [Arthrobacter sp. NicSoilB8]